MRHRLRGHRAIPGVVRGGETVLRLECDSVTFVCCKCRSCVDVQAKSRDDRRITSPDSLLAPPWGALQGGPWPFQNFGWVGHNAFGPTNNWPVWSLILHCGLLILRKISKTGASRYQILRLKCTKFTFCWGSAPDPAWELTVPPDLCLYLRGLLLRGWRETGLGKKG